MKRVLSIDTVFFSLALVALLLSAGCTSRSGSEDSSLQGGRDGLPATLPGIPATAPTMPPALYQDIDEVKDTLYSLSQEWESTGLTCSSNSCSGGFVDTAGNTLAIRATLYPDMDTAHSAYEAEKEKGSDYRQFTPPQGGDEAYAWQYRNTAEIGMRKSNLVIIFEYVATAGVVSVTQVKEVTAGITAGL
ncbi:MAG: hypothetical protein MUC66_06295 [Methanolinea sp.]|jgi:hypothetical protein|nr:hypothetical protein [Methanolinea sp.]